MTESQARALVASLFAAFPHINAGQATVEIYCHYLLDLDADLAVQAVEQATTGARFLPAIGEIRHEYAALKLQAPGEADAYGQALSPPPRHPLVQRARELVGDDWTWRTEPAHLTRRDFTAMYRSLLDDATRQIVQASPERPELAGVVREITR